jgi:hypothetical protein
MAMATQCQTPGTWFTTHINGDNIRINVELPFVLELPEEEAELLEKNIHNALELVLSLYFR